MQYKINIIFNINNEIINIHKYISTILQVINFVYKMIRRLGFCHFLKLIILQIYLR